MPTYSFTSIDVPAADGTYTYIGVTGVDAAGEAVGYYGSVDGDGDGTYYGFVANSASGIPYNPPGSSNTNGISISATGEIYGDYVDYFNRQHGFTDDSGVVTTVDFFPNTYTTVSGITATGVLFGDYELANLVGSFIDNNGVYSTFSVV